MPFVKVVDILNARVSTPARPLCLGYLVFAYLSNRLSGETYLEIVYPDDYFEYILVEHDEGFNTVVAMLHAYERIPLDDLNHRLLTRVGADRFQSYTYPLIDKQFEPEDLLNRYLNGALEDFLIFQCLPYAVEVEKAHDGTYETVIEEFSTIPAVGSVYLGDPADRLNIRLRSSQTNANQVVLLGEMVEKDEVRICVDADYVRYIEMGSGRKVYF